MNMVEIIKQIKKDNNWELQEIAEKLGMSKQNLSNKMKRGSFSVAEMINIGKLMGMDLAFVPEGANVKKIMIEPVTKEEK